MVVIENGIDVETLQFNASERALVRQEWRVADGEQLIGLVARLDPMKDHPTFLAASALLSRRDSMVRFVCVGDGPPVYRSKLFAQAQSLGLGDRVMWAGLRDDMPAVYSALDIAVSSSSGEGFCNAVAEAMACGVPCVVTQVGESPDIVGDVGRVVPAGNAEALAAALLEMLGLPVEERLLMGQAARRRIASLYSLDRMVERTADLLDVE
jgi:glycosyltransferase involved in cell wall biosynthesis